MNEALRPRWSNNDNKNKEIIADMIEEITSSISDWAELDEKNENSDTANWAHILSNIASKLRGEWPDEISIK